MHPLRKRRLWLVLALVASTSAAVGLIMYALSENIDLFYPPEDIASGKAPIGKQIRAGGMVVNGSVKREPGQLAMEFRVTDYKAEVTVRYEGILPDMFREGQGIVATGVLNEQRVLTASQVLAKHDENYMPAEVKDALEKSGRHYEMSSEKAPASPFKSQY